MAKTCSTHNKELVAQHVHCSSATQRSNRNFAAGIPMFTPSALNTILSPFISSSLPFFQMSSHETSSIFTATAHGGDVVSVVLQQEDGQSAMVAEVAASTLVSASPIEVASEVNTPSACAQASQVNSLIWSALACVTHCLSGRGARRHCP